MKVDLHIHSTASDGTNRPKEVVQLAFLKKMRVIALTDHDTVDGLVEAEQEAKKWGIEFVKGIEFSSYWKGREVHILGYFLNLEVPEFLQELAFAKEKREERNKKILDILRKYDIMINMQTLEEKYPGQTIGRTHIAKEMVAMEKVQSIAEAFSKYLGEGGLAYVEKDGFSPHEAIRILKRNGAFSSLAHPKYICRDENEILDLIRELKELGLDAIEANYGGFSSYEIRKYRSWAKKFSLEITGGSDYHGSNRKNSEIGMQGIDYSQYKKFRRDL